MDESKKRPTDSKTENELATEGTWRRQRLRRRAENPVEQAKPINVPGKRSKKRKGN